MTMDIIRKGDRFELHHSGDEEGEPVLTFDNPDDCEERCKELGYRPRYRKYASLVKPWFLKDVEKRADDAVGKIRDVGLVVRSDVTYRASAAWKEQPTHYAYIGDFGGVAKLEDAGDRACSDAAYTVGKGWLRELFGMATALWELGFTLTFDEDGKHTVFGNYPEWVTVDEIDDL